MSRGNDATTPNTQALDPGAREVVQTREAQARGEMRGAEKNQPAPGGMLKAQEMAHDRGVINDLSAMKNMVFGDFAHEGAWPSVGQPTGLSNPVTYASYSAALTPGINGMSPSDAIGLPQGNQPEQTSPQQQDASLQRQQVADALYSRIMGDMNAVSMHGQHRGLDWKEYHDIMYGADVNKLTQDLNLITRIDTADAGLVTQHPHHVQAQADLPAPQHHKHQVQI